MHVGDDVDAESDHVAHHRAHLIVALAVGSGGIDGAGIDLGVHDLDVQTFLGIKARFQSNRGVEHMPRMPATIAHSKFHSFSILAVSSHALLFNQPYFSTTGCSRSRLRFDFLGL